MADYPCPHFRCPNSSVWRALGAPGCFTDVSSDIQNDLIVCIDSIIEHQIVQEIKNCTFLSIQIDEATDVSTIEQLSIIIGLDSNGDIV